MTEQRERRKVRVGRVVSDKMDKTVVVAVERRVKHRLYGKSRRHVTRFAVHDEANDYRLGDMVRIVETRPLSRTKRWRVSQLLARQEVPEAAAIEAPVAAPIVAPTPVRRRGRRRAVIAAVVASDAVVEESEAPAAESEEPADAAVEESESPAAESEEPTDAAVEESEAPAAEAEEPTDAVVEESEAPAAEAEEPSGCGGRGKRSACGRG